MKLMKYPIEENQEVKYNLKLSTDEFSKNIEAFTCASTVNKFNKSPEERIFIFQIETWGKKMNFDGRFSRKFNF